MEKQVLSVAFPATLEQDRFNLAEQKKILEKAKAMVSCSPLRKNRISYIVFRERPKDEDFLISVTP